MEGMGDSDTLIRFEVHVRREAIPADELAARVQEIRAELPGKPQPCLRASLLPEKYGWGVHHDRQGRIALHPMESEEYRRIARSAGSGPTLWPALRSKRS